MDPPDLLCAREIGDGARDPKHAVEAARGQPHRRGSVSEELAPGLIRCRNPVEQFAIGFGVGASTVAIVSFRLNLPGGGDAFSDFQTSLGRWRQREIGG